jgi:hypothetical protein
MKKIMILVCSIIITATAFAQIKNSNSMVKSTMPVKQNVVIAAINTNRDSVELSQLYEAYKIADAEATYKLQLLIAKTKEVQAKNNANQTEQERGNSEMKMAKLSSLMEDRTKLLQFTTNLLNSINQPTNIVQNLK